MYRTFTILKNKPRQKHLSAKLSVKKLIPGVCIAMLCNTGAWATSRPAGANRFAAEHFSNQNGMANKTNIKDIEVRGRVTDKSGMPLPGVTIRVKGTSAGVTTDLNGNFRIKVADGNAVLVFSFTGYVPQERAAGDGQAVNIVLIEDNKTLGEVVVVGYGEQRKATVTGAVARANIDAFRNAPNVNIAQSLQGTVAGLNVGPVTGAGNTPTIRVRGRNTIGGTQSALIILDGVQYNGDIASINPDDIESVDVLKDASSTAVYGAQAANGVVLITTRKGKGAARVNLTSSYTTQTPTSKIRPMNREEELEYIKALDMTRSYTNPNYVQPPITTIADGGIKNAQGLLPNDFNWYDAGTNNGLIADLGLSISGGSEKISYLISGNYTNQRGFIMNDLFRRKAARVNVEGKVNSWLTVGVQSSATFNNFDGAEPDMTTLFRTSPLLVPYRPDGSLIVQPYSTSQDINPFSTSNVTNFDRRNAYFANLYGVIDFPFLKGLSYRVNFGNNGRTNNLYIANPYGASQTGAVSKEVTQYYDYLIDNILTYNRRFNKHNFTATAVYGAIERREEFTNANATGFTRLTLGYNDLSQGTIQKVASGGFRESLNYQMARLNYVYSDKYILTATVRRDGFSGFAANHKYAIFPSVSFGYVLSDEEFFKVPAIQYIKIRGGYGAVGNQVGRYQSLAEVTANYTYLFGDNQSTLFGQRLTNLENPNLQWERTTEFNIGVDFTLFKGRLSGSIDAYDRKTTDLLFRVNIPNITGFTAITDNVGGVSNRGLEVTLNSININQGGFKWSSSVNFSRNVNKVTELLGTGDLVNSNLFIGQPIDPIYDYRFNGIYGPGETIPTGYYQGTRRVLDTNGDGVVNTNDRAILGSRDPAYRVSLLNTFTYKNFTLSAFLNSIQGGTNNYLANNNPSLILNDNNMRYNNVAGIDFWSPSNPTGVYTRSQVSPTFSPGYWRTRNFVRLQDVTLQYALPQRLLKKININNASIYVSGKNLYTWTTWQGWDPEIADGGLNMGGRPLLKGYTLGLNITL